MKHTAFPLSILVAALLAITLYSCSHAFDPNTLDLDFYQWNLWEDAEAVPGDILPSCGWEDLHRGKGKLVRIPAPLDLHFPDRDARDIFWYHCRFTLPEQWEEKAVSLIFEEAGPRMEVFLNEEHAGSFEGERGRFEMNVSETIFYTRDNHLAIRISNPPGGSAETLKGITGTIQVKPDLETSGESEATYSYNINPR